jgi:hypothetical protein
MSTDLQLVPNSLPNPIRTAAEIEEEIRKEQTRIRDLYQQLELQRIHEKALANFSSTFAPSSTQTNEPPSQLGRKKFSPIPKEIKHLVVKNVLYE